MFETIKQMLDNVGTDEGMEALLSFPIRVDVRAEWYSPYDGNPDPCEYRILLPMKYRVVGDLYNGKVVSASLQEYDDLDGWRETKHGNDARIMLQYAKTVMKYS